MLRETFAVGPHRRLLLNVSNGQCIGTHLPELRGHDVFGPSTGGLLVLLDRSTYVVRLLNPLTRQVTDLPPATTLYRLYRGRYEWPLNTGPREDFKVTGAGLADDSTFAVRFYGIQMLAVVKPGYEHWTLVDQDTSLSPTISFAGRFYCTTDRAIMVVETSANQPPRLVVAAKLTSPFSRIAGTVHLVDNDGELVLVYRTLRSRAALQDDEEEDFIQDYIEYKVFRVDLDARKTKPVRSLVGRAVLIGSSRAISVSPLVFPSVRNDSIYLGRGNMLGARFESTRPYHLVDATTKSYCSDEGRGIADPCGSDKDSGRMPRYGHGDIDDYLSRYVTGSRYNSDDT